MSALIGYQARRLAQFNEEERIDFLLTEARCNLAINAYLLDARKLNRDESRAIYEASLWNTPHMVEAQLDKIDARLAKFRDVKTPIDMCRHLARFKIDTR